MQENSFTKPILLSTYKRYIFGTFFFSLEFIKFTSRTALFKSQIVLDINNLCLILGVPHFATFGSCENKNKIKSV